MNGWNAKNLINFIFALQSQSADNYVSLLLSKEQIKRINYESDIPQTLDDCTQIDKLISKADDYLRIMLKNYEILWN